MTQRCIAGGIWSKTISPKSRSSAPSPRDTTRQSKASAPTSTLPLRSSPQGKCQQTLDPSLSGSYLCLCQDARGCDVRSSGFAIDVAFALDGLGFPLAGGDPPGVDMVGQFHQSLGHGAWVGLTPNAPVFGRQGDEHAS